MKQSYRPEWKKSVASLCAAAVLATVLGCDNLSDYSTKNGSCYLGEIIDADFLRTGAFEAGVRMTMFLDVDALSAGEADGAIFTTDDGLFKDASARQMIELTRDSLSQLSFPGGRVRNYLAYAPDVTGLPANAVISLMENGDVEVRLFRAGRTPEETLFGVFRLVLNEFCIAAPPPTRDASDDSEAR